MAEIQAAQVEVSLTYACDSGDGGMLYYSATVFDQLGGVAYEHTCTNPEDRNVYKFLTKYPSTKFVNVNINQILA